MNQEWKIGDLAMLFFKNNKENYITDVGIIKSFTNVGEEEFANIYLLYSKLSPINTYIHAPRKEVQIIHTL